MRDFTHKSYASLIESLRDSGYIFTTVASADFSQAFDHPHIILRHDVDRFPKRAVAMALLEYSQNIAATYYFRARRSSFDRNAIYRIHQLGHEIGYHYECLPDTRGNYPQAWKLFCENIRLFDFIGGIRTIAMHGRPLSQFDTRELWKYYNYQSMGILYEAYIDIPWDRYLYLTDTGGAWDSRDNIRDHHGHKSDLTAPEAHSSWDVAALLSARRTSAVLSVHPERWARGLTGWAQVRTTDFLANRIKRLGRAL